MKLSILTTVFAHALCVVALPAAHQEPLTLAPFYRAKEPSFTDVYIVKFKDFANHRQIREHIDTITEFCTTLNQQFGAAQDSIKFEVISTYSLFKGYAVRLPPQAVSAIQKSGLVDYVEEESVQYVSTPEVEKNAPWGISRLSSRDRSNERDYLYDTDGGKGVTVYVIDTGVYEAHNDFEGRAKLVAAMGSLPLADDHGHGSHCSGTAIGKKYGVAKKANVAGIKVCDYRGSCMTSDILSGIEFAVNMHDALLEKDPKYKGGIISMSLGGAPSATQDLALKIASEKHNLLAAVAAGNEMDDACDSSPARGEAPITVGATDVYDWKAYFSNDGSCVDIFAPGVNIVSVGTSSKDDYEVMSGTSMATPHVAGLAAYFLSLQPKGLASKITAADLKSKILAFGTRGVVKGKWSSGPDVFAFNGAGSNLTDFWGASSAAELSSLNGAIKLPTGLEAFDELRASGHYNEDWATFSRPSAMLPKVLVVEDFDFEQMEVLA